MATASLTTDATADTLMTFDNTKIYIVKSTQKYYGYYSGTSTQSYLSGENSGKTSCSFFFIQTNKSDWPATINAWESPTRLRYAQAFEPGALYKKDNGVFAINFQAPPPGCRSKPDGDSLVRKANTIDTAEPIHEDDQGLTLHPRKSTKIHGIAATREAYPPPDSSASPLPANTVAIVIKQGKSISTIAPLNEKGIISPIKIPTRLLTPVFK